MADDETYPDPVEPVPAYDRYARLTRAMCEVPIAMVTFLEEHRQTFPGAVGLPGSLQATRETPLEYSLCHHVVDSEAPVVAPDARLHPLLHDSPAISELGVVAYAGFPVRDVRGEAVASLCAIDVVPHPWTEAELAVLADLAAACSAEFQLRERTAQTLDTLRESQDSDRRTAALLEERRGVAHTLQTAMLTDLPEPAGVDLAAVYAPASDTEEVGGDWYDAMVLSDRGFALAVGDVTGHDLQAATVMGQLRSMLRALWWEHDKPPSFVLHLLDDASLGTGLEATGTALLARLEPQTADGVRRLTWSSAGHPSPVVLRADGSVEIPEGKADLMLGVVPDVLRHDHWFNLHPGDVVVLYTDGLVERRGESFGRGVDRLVETLTTGGPGIGAGSVQPTALLEALAPAAGREDDVVVLTALFTDAPDPEPSPDENVAPGVED